MVAHRKALTIYQIARSIDGSPVTDFDHVVLPQVLADAALQTTDVDAGLDFEGRLYVVAPPPDEPAWAEFLRDGLGDAFVVTPTAANRALLVIRFRYYGADRYFALTFGNGRYLMRRNAYVRTFGLKTALNLIYEGDTLDGTAPADRIRQVDSKTVADNTFRTRRQANRDTSFEQFGLDIQRDLLNTVTGEPARRSEWGSRVYGADQVNVNLPIEFADLGDLGKRLWRTARADDYEVHFSWIDNLSAIAEPARVAELRDAVAASLRAGTADSFELAAPELVDWDEIESFTYSLAPDDEFGDLALGDYLSLVAAAGLTPSLDWELVRTHRIAALDASGDELFRWPVALCLFGELDDDGDTILLDSGEFFVVAPGYLAELDAFIGGIPESTVDLPPSHLGTDGDEITEGEYNELAAAHLPTNLLLDKRTVRVASSTSPIEICDVLTTDRAFVHVKRKLQSASLSHLFGQGYVSGDLFLGSPEYRTAVANEIAAAETDKGSGSIFSDALDFDAPDPASIEIVYGVVADWNGDAVVDRLPFFSKVNLRRHTADLRRMGYRVTFKRIGITA